MSDGTRSVVITGAGGFVGTSLTRGFAGLGWNVWGVDTSFDEGWSSIGAHCVAADLAEGWPAGLPNADVIIHAAWTTSDSTTLGLTKAEYASLNLLPLLRVLEHAARAVPSAFVFLSSTGVFAESDGGSRLADSDTPTSPSPYAASKRAGEQLVPAALNGDTRAHVVRLGYLYGPDEVERPTRSSLSQVARWLDAARAGEPLVVRSDDPEREWTFAPDLALALDRLLQGPGGGQPVHLGSPYVRRDSVMAELVSSAFDHGVSADRTGAVPGLMKPPMRPSDVPALAAFAWTTPEDGVREIVREEALT